MSLDQPQSPRNERTTDHTARLVADAVHLQGLAKSFAMFLEVATKEDCAEPHAASLLRSTYEDLCEALATARRLTGNREPEMGEALAELHCLEEEYRELLG